MNALRLDPSERVFASVYEPRTRPRLTRKHLIAIGVTAAAYGAIGFYFVNQQYEIVPAPAFSDPPVVTGKWLRIEPEPPKPVVTKEQPPKPVTQRPPQTTIPIDIPTSPIAATDAPPSNVVPTTAVPVPNPPIASPEPVVSAPTTAPPGVIRNPVWVRRPTAEEAGRLYPERALNRGIAGSATLWCGIRADGTMTDCQVVDESPAGWRFGAAALSMAKFFRISPKTVDGKAVEGSRVRIPVVFSLPD